MNCAEAVPGASSAQARQMTIKILMTNMSRPPRPIARSTAGNIPLRDSYSRLLIDDLARADRVGKFGEVAHGGHGIATKDHQLSITSPFDPAALAAVQLLRRVGREGGDHLPSRQRAAHP